MPAKNDVSKLDLPSSRLRFLSILKIIIIVPALAGCVMAEEVKRIEAVKNIERRQAESTSTNLTGAQVFMRSCNTCHPGGGAVMGPALDKLEEHFPNDELLKQFIRSGKGIMPAQPSESINKQELENLIRYLRKKPISASAGG